MTALKEANVRWMMRRDMKDIVNIESLSFERPWCEEDFFKQLNRRNCIGMVCENNLDLVGFMIYELHADRLKILNFAVHPDHRRKGFGLVMMNRMMGKLSHELRRTIAVTVRETNLDFQLFLRELCFMAIKVHRGFYEDCDGYVFEYIHKIPVQDDHIDLGKSFSRKFA